MIKREYSDYLQDIFESINALEEFVKDMRLTDFKKDRKTMFAAIRCFEVIGEATKNMPRSIRNTYNDVPWIEMAGMRDKLIHEYFGIDVAVLWKTIKKDIPHVKKLISKIIESEVS